MRKKLTLAVFGFFSLALLALIVLLVRGYTFGVLEPAGLVASQERALMFHALLLMAIVVIPVFMLAFAIAWRYREGNTGAAYTPDWEHSRLEELIWWAVPIEIILVLGALTWSSTHQLDPRRALDVPGTPLVIEVVALDWKWLFIYPSLGIATVNELEFPAGVPLEFDITADAPMNSFWIPRLGGQIYAMTGMTTQLHLIADQPGVFAGGSANYSGDGFAQMQFQAKALSQNDFDAWATSVKRSPQTLDAQTYAALAAPGTSLPATYALTSKNFYDTIVEKFMSPASVGTHH